MNMYRSLTLIALLFASAPLASAQIANGSFESFTGNTDGVLLSELGDIGVDNLGTASSWVFGQGAGIAVGPTTDGNAAAWLSPTTLDGNAVISQIFSIENAGNYSLRWNSFAEGGLFNPSILPDQAEPVAGYNVDLSVVGGDSLLNSDFLENPFDDLATSHSVSFNAAAGLYQLTFTGLGVPPGTFLSSSDTFIDNVAVAVPEPGSVLMAMAAGLGLVLRRRR